MFDVTPKPQQASDSADVGIETAQIERCFRQLPISLAVNLINGGILVFVLWNAAAKTVILIWSLLLIAVTAVRFLTLQAFKKAHRDDQFAYADWVRYFVVGAGAAGVVWGTAGILLFHGGSLPHQVFLTFVLGGMVAGAVPLLSSVDHAYHFFAVPIVVPISIQMVLVGDRIHVIMGVMAAVFGLAMLATSAQVRRAFRDSDTLRRQLLSSMQASNALEHLVRMDTLTAIANRRLFEEELGREWGRAEREKLPLALITADIDHFKEYNDFYGHPAGDRCLVEVAQAMQSALARSGDLVARIGGEEFAFLLPNTTLNGALTVAQQIHEHILALNLPHETSPVADQVTLSFGVASSDDPTVTSRADLVRASDMALYDAKRRGRNQIRGTTSYSPHLSRSVEDQAKA